MIASRAPAPGSSADDARVCRPGSLDAGQVRNRIVLCERGDVGRVDKSRAVRLADGVGMVLVNQNRGSLDEDFHSVPTVHLARSPGQALERWAAEHPDARVTLRPVGRAPTTPRVANWSSGGDSSGILLKPDVVAPATGVLGAAPADDGGIGWEFVTGTSAATAYAAGVAATIIAERDLPATAVRSALATTAEPVRGSALEAGAGRINPREAATPGLIHPLDATDYRQWLEGRRTHLNTPSILLGAGQRVARRTVTNIGRRALYFSSRAVGFRHHVSVRPAALRLAPGESAAYRVIVRARGDVAPLDDGYVVWRGASGSATRVPVLLSR